MGLGLADEGGKRLEVVAGALGGDTPRVEKHAGREDGDVAARDQKQLRALRVGLMGFGWGLDYIGLDWGWVGPNGFVGSCIVGRLGRVWFVVLFFFG